MMERGVDIEPGMEREAHDHAAPRPGELVETAIAEYQSPLLRYAARLLRDPVAAQDVVQNVFVKLARRADGGAPPREALKSWLYRVTHNEAVDTMRRETRLRLLHDRHGEWVEINEPASGGDDMTEQERKQTVLRFVHKLHPREKQVLLLRLEEGLSYQEIAAVTGRSEGNVGNLLHHAVRKLSLALTQAGAIS